MANKYGNVRSLAADYLGVDPSERANGIKIFGDPRKNGFRYKILVSHSRNFEELCKLSEILNAEVPQGYYVTLKQHSWVPYYSRSLNKRLFAVDVNIRKTLNA